MFIGLSSQIVQLAIELLTRHRQNILIHRVVDVAIEFTQPLPEIPNWKEFKITTL